MNVLEYFSGQGRILIGERLATGMPGPLRWVGDDSAVEFSFEPDVAQYKENYTGQRAVGLRITRELVANLNTTLLQQNYENFKLALRGDEHEQAVTAVTDQVVSEVPLAVGQIFVLGAFEVGSVTIEDSTPVTPLVLTADVNYTLDAKSGSVEIIDATTGGPFVAPFKASFTPGADVSYVKMLTAAEKEYWFRFDGFNTVPGATYGRVIADFYRWSPSPTQGMPLINEERLESEIQGQVLIDPSKSAAGPFGQFGRIVMLQSA